VLADFSRRAHPFAGLDRRPDGTGRRARRSCHEDRFDPPTRNKGQKNPPAASSQVADCPALSALWRFKPTDGTIHPMSAAYAAADEARRRFLELVADLRPALHRYCARMTGSTADGEDIVQDTLLRAYDALSELDHVPPLRPWLFRIAHNRALDHLRRYDRRMGQSLDASADRPSDAFADPEEALAREQAVRAALSLFIQLAPAQRSAVVLKDVLGHSLEEIAELLELTVPAVKAALHRGRTRLRELEREPGAAPARAVSPAVARYARLINARDWDGVRAMLADDVRLDLVSHATRIGRHDVDIYYTNYARLDLHMVPAWLDGREVLAVFRDRTEPHPSYFIQLTVAGERIAVIRDYRYVPYILQDAALLLAPESAG
jgi:RNA polymerase sigma factor (sigma-70 family)